MLLWAPGGHLRRRWNAWQNKDVTPIVAGDPLQRNKQLSKYQACNK